LRKNEEFQSKEEEGRGRRVVLFTSGQFLHHPLREDLQLMAELKSRKLEVELVVWDEFEEESGGADVYVVRTIRDTHQKGEKKWKQYCFKISSQNVLNGALLERNRSKIYLLELLPYAVPSGRAASWSDVVKFSKQFPNSESFVLKPLVGSLGTGVVRIRLDDQSKRLLAKQWAHGEFLVQPLVPSITAGEWSFIFFQQHLSHCVRKVPIAGEFKVQGGKVTRESTPPLAAIRVAEAVLKQIGASDYARVDLVEYEGQWRLQELELLDPELFLPLHPEAVRRFADTIVNKMDNKK
jgi:glutathione synthase/RimK-type ligase-like ATP-grasp enzyme